MKNINSVIMTGALLLIAAGCSKSKVEVINEPQSQEDAWVNDLSLPVPIEFSAPSALSKATPSGPVEGTVMDDLDIGIYALAITDGQPETPSHSGPHTQIWNTSNAASVLLRNEHATTGTDGSITLDETKYYPIDSDYSYSFFGYYPYTGTVDAHTDYVRILFNIGYTDILYAADHAQKFSAIQDLIGFNAEYIRWLKRTSNYYELHGPKLDFKHMLTSLKISAVIKNLGAEEQGNIRIQSVKLKNAYNDAYLYVADSGWTIALLRYFNPVGAHESGLIGEDPKGIPNNLTPYIAKVAIGELKEIGVFGNDYPTPDGTGVRDYIHVVDLAKGHVAAIHALSKPGVYTYNLGTGIGYSVLDVIHAFERACGKKLPYVIKPRRAGDIAACYANADKAKAELHWQAQLGLDDMCASLWKWQTQNPNGYRS